MTTRKQEACPSASLGDLPRGRECSWPAGGGAVPSRQQDHPWLCVWSEQARGHASSAAPGACCQNTGSPTGGLNHRPARSQ